MQWRVTGFAPLGPSEVRTPVVHRPQTAGFHRYIAASSEAGRVPLRPPSQLFVEALNTSLPLRCSTLCGSTAFDTRNAPDRLVFIVRSRVCLRQALETERGRRCQHEDADPAMAIDGL